MSHYPKTKIYFDGSHFIGIPLTTQFWKKRKCKNTKTKDKIKEKFETLYKENADKPKKEKKEIITNEIEKELKSKEITQEHVESQFARKRRNAIERMKRLYRKVYLQEWNYFCTFTIGIISSAVLVLSAVSTLSAIAMKRIPLLGNK